MKKLILILTLTLAMMFGQTKLETRVYEYSVSLYGGEYYDITLSDLTNGDVIDNQYAFIEIMGIADESQISNNTNINMMYAVDSFNAQYQEVILARIQGLGTSIPFLNTQNSRRALYEKNMNHKIISDEDFIGTLIFAITAEFPQEDTGYIEDGFDYCVEPGANLMSYPCDSDVALLDAIPADALSQFSGIIGQGLASVQLPNGTWVGSLTNMQASSGYWITSTTSLCFNYDCSEN